MVYILMSKKYNIQLGIKIKSIDDYLKKQTKLL